MSVTLSVPVRVPVVVGVKVTLTVQAAFAAKVPAQLLVWAKSPVAATADMLRLAVPVFVSVTDRDELVLPTV